MPIANEDTNRKRRVSDRKKWELREKFSNSIARARTAIEQARELGFDLGAPRFDQSGNLLQLSPTFAMCLSALTAQVEADEADQAKYVAQIEAEEAEEAEEAKYG